MSKPKVTYFDAPVSRGEEVRLALHVAGVDFEDNRLKRDAWPAFKANTPFGSLPLFELAGKPVLAQSNAILAYIGREHDLHPKDSFEAARHEAILQYCEDARTQVAPTIRMPEDEKKKIREELSTTYLPAWGANVEKQIGDGPFFGGTKLHVVDIKIFVVTRWLKSGGVDHIATTVFDACPKLNRLHAAVRDHAAVKAWTSKF